MKKTRHYYKVKVHRYPPYYGINQDYYHDEYVWAYSRKGAENRLNRYHKKGYGRDIPVEFTEITKDEYNTVWNFEKIN